MEGWANCLSEGFMFIVLPNLEYTFGAGSLHGLGAITHSRGLFFRMAVL